MKKLLFLAALLLLAACVHKIDIQQGNVVTPGMLNHLHTGMTKAEVINTLGNPILVNTFNDNQIDYVYTLKPGYGQLQERYITLIFQNNVLRDIQTNMRS